ncbi:hypothetical protein BKP56_01355 [Marinilactibacillus sp. 15R]|uniref:Uncharacterized protein n=1 Tax=Marinilactibacillus piezotolerans TaxID=258723 RepID=A0A1I3XRN7_9LACT|nr:MULTISPECIES: DUF6442 family protein [Marinilactibacillus]API88059.1 hypothetical protein BKP56_01355 [Marinilactibacillus sp. 15R]SFK22133.1 hypothetical protein SAMN04488569_101633 [Marinilactibacillus piezotolerans]|tara:strand:- start:4535 stop:4846 length:312 start_codon:yes stop_codon:yes gene_type:complete
MDKQEILKKARKEQDEREKVIKTYAFRIGWIGVVLVTLFILVLRMLNKETVSDILLILMTQLAAASFYQYSNIHNKKHLVTGVISLVAVALNFAALLSQYGVY